MAIGQQGAKSYSQQALGTQKPWKAAVHLQEFGRKARVQLQCCVASGSTALRSSCLLRLLCSIPSAVVAKPAALASRAAFCLFSTGAILQQAQGDFAYDLCSTQVLDVPACTC